MFTSGRFQTRYARLVAMFVVSAVALLTVVGVRSHIEAQVMSYRYESVAQGYNRLDACGQNKRRITGAAEQTNAGSRRLAQKGCRAVHKAASGR